MNFSGVISSSASQHAEEVAFLCLLLVKGIRQPHYALKDLVKLDDRVEAHLDAVPATVHLMADSLCVEGSHGQGHKAIRSLPNLLHDWR